MIMFTLDYLFATEPGRVWIFNRSSKVITRIYTVQLTYNCAWLKMKKDYSWLPRIIF